MRTRKKPKYAFKRNLIYFRSYFYTAIKNHISKNLLTTVANVLKENHLMCLAIIVLVYKGGYCR